MGSYNRVTLVGNLGKDMDLRYTPGGAAVGKFSMATTETWRDKQGEKKEQTDWHNIVVWGKQAETLSEYLVKGKQVLVEGSIHTRSYEKDGEKKWITEIKAHRIVLLGGGSQGGGQRRRGQERPSDSGSEFGGEDDFTPPPDDEFGG